MSDVCGPHHSTLTCMRRGRGPRGPLQVVGHAQGGGHSLPRGEAGARLQVRPQPTPQDSRFRPLICSHMSSLLLQCKVRWCFACFMHSSCITVMQSLPCKAYQCLPGARTSLMYHHGCAHSHYGCIRGCRDTTKEFMGAMPSVYDRILSCFALGLGYPEDFFREVRSLLSHGPFLWVPCDLHDTLPCAGALHGVCTEVLRCTCSTK